MIASPSSIQQQRPDYYQQTNKNMPPIYYNNMLDSRPGLPLKSN
jgi:hypothetical protein